MNKYLLTTLLTVLACCADDPDQSETTAWLLPAAGTCAVPGAVPNDGIDDRLAIQTALTTQGCADLPSGQFDVFVTNPRANGLDRYDLLKLIGGRSLRGAGPATVIKFSGDAARSDIHGVGMTGNDNLVSDLTLDTTGLTNTSEQTHAIQIAGAALAQKVSGVWFHHPSLGAGAGGDCIKVVGYDPVYDTTTGAQLSDKRVSLVVINNIFVECDRSGITVHGGVYGFAATGNLFLGSGDQDIDFEGSDGVGDVAITGNVTRRINSAPSMSLGTILTSRLTVTGNTLGGGLYLYDTKQAVISGNTIESSGPSKPAIESVKVADDLVISGNILRYTNPAEAIAVVKITHHNSGNPGSISVVGNKLWSSTTNGVMIAVTSATDAEVVGNSFQWAPVTPQTAATVAVSIQGIVQLTEAILVSNNVFRGPWTRAFQTSNSYETNGGGIRAVTFVGNMMRGPTYGLYCNGQSGPGPFVATGNSGAVNQCGATITAGN